MIGEYTLKTIAKNILAASMSGTLALMGAPPETPRTRANVESTSFQPADVRLIGTITAKGNGYVLTDPKTGATAEVRGKGIKRFAGMSVTIEGKVAGRPQAESGKSTLLVQVVRITSNSNKAMQSSFAPGAAMTITLVSAAAGGVLGGLYASGVLGEDEKPASRP